MHAVARLVVYGLLAVALGFFLLGPVVVFLLGFRL